MPAVPAPAWLLQSPDVTAAHAAQDGRNLALGKPVVFAPIPDYPLTSAGGTDATDLTDGKLSTGKTDGSGSTAPAPAMRLTREFLSCAGLIGS